MDDQRSQRTEQRTVACKHAGEAEHEQHRSEHDSGTGRRVGSDDPSSGLGRTVAGSMVLGRVTVPGPAGATTAVDAAAPRPSAPSCEAEPVALRVLRSETHAA